MPKAGVPPRLVAPRNLGYLAPLGLIGAVLALVVPVSPSLLDLLLAANVAAAVLILLQTVQVRRPLEFSVFPALLLTTTLARLVLNVASTRLILTEAPLAGVEAAGGVIATFGEFVAAGSPYVGGVVFAILVAIQFLVITKGATRISEVAARFALDGLPGRQAAIDADLASGLLSPAEARERRHELVRQADFYGAMDGASKFVRGDAVAGLLITGINIVGGLAIGVLGEGMPLAEAVALYTTLTIGDGLVSQVPALLISLAAGLIVTRSSTDSDLPSEAVEQMAAHPLPLAAAAGFLMILGLVGFPTLPMFALAGVCGAAAWWLANRSTSAPQTGTGAVVTPLGAGARSGTSPTPAAPPPVAPSPLERHLHVEPLELDLGVSLVRLADPAAGGDLLERVTQLRERIASDLGFILPKVRIQDDLRLDPREFRIKLRGVPETSGTVYTDALLAVNDGFVAGPLTGLDGIEPATGRSGVWIDASQAEEGRRLGYRLLPPQVVILQQLEQVVRRRAAELLTREHVHDLLKHLRRRTPHLVEELVPARLTGGDIHRVLAELLEDGIPIRDLETILETLGDAVARHPRALIPELASDVRAALRRTIAQRFADSRGVLHLIHLEIGEDARLPDDLELLTTFHPDRTSRERLVPWLAPLAAALERLTATGHPPVVLCRSECRTAVRDLLRSSDIRAVVLSPRDLPREQAIKVHAEISAATTSQEPPPPSHSVHLSQAAQLTSAAA
jgi:flagellar biosynthesis protein FlhA